MEHEVSILKPARDFICSLDSKMRAKIYRTIDLLKEFGIFLPEPHAKAIKSAKGLRELRIKLGSNICRLFYFYHKNNMFIITSGFIKKSQKTDKREIEKAINLMNTFLEDYDE